VLNDINIADCGSGTPCTSSHGIERELAANAEKCKQRAQLLSDAIANLGGVPGVVGVAVGRVGAAVKASTNKGRISPRPCSAIRRWSTSCSTVRASRR
jgi:hypothetical protein